MMRFYILIMILLIAGACSEENSGKEVVSKTGKSFPKSLGDDTKTEKLLKKTEEKIERGEMKRDYFGLQNFYIPNTLLSDSSSRYRMAIEMHNYRGGIKMTTSPENFSWDIIHNKFLEELAKAEQSEFATFYQQYLAMCALTYLLEQDDVKSHVTDLAFYTEILLENKNGNAYVLSESLTNLQDYWSKKRIKLEANKALEYSKRLGKKEIEDFKSSYALFPEKRIEEHTKGVALLETLAHNSDVEE